MTYPQFPDDVSRPKPVRVAAWTFSFALLVLGLLPVFGVAISAAALGAVTVVLGALLGGVALLVEKQVTPVASPQDNAGNRLTP